ncbi:MAG: 50S ribosomal protein L22 [Candidatus Brennerbacteria bacterium RIFOXYC1_FULL_41_11]|uniref:Large ribosomal subunit protein uL22 n=1 Tax=Candidatus Brennerbacteria bacterium RIFOXYD1_FULL_41_16 TaxID=1797529 RepID=A0A1G1XJJ1_9BACT|nr:MAG: 50S ribosomal protein L22 [Parcubacteria group bacterium GW2011_GWB1_41_4]OGY38763.1 MAG: 50S ribosomal protein L22 [Candidatus Brennerbacteria bacterium RIFOXYB1_FULL_41_13]OGY39046.1 MAG: 50S ribosomal protein L22 [Candidatus Brennerbacteria bacterium RIFOXYC1_FULL_41_11]OGY40199.1 MAG: 50S ribosomal protein L22 [Candidatus Brennerbacteria bacterium RIFOXYD1_FULL_41_16]HCJ52194.1 50S ribosomal protein L22 [Candidatus Kerfeldbacteria bacterium]
MDSVFAKLRNLRVSPKKVRQVTRLLKGMSYFEAESQLLHLPQKSVPGVLKLLRSAGANAENNFNLSKQDIFVSKILVDAGPTLKRMMERARGRGMLINKRTSQITLFLSSKSGKKIDLASSAKHHSSVNQGKTKISTQGRSAKAHIRNKSVAGEKGRKSSGVKRKIFSRKAI